MSKWDWQNEAHYQYAQIKPGVPLIDDSSLLPTASFVTSDFLPLEGVKLITLWLMWPLVWKELDGRMTTARVLLVTLWPLCGQGGLTIRTVVGCDPGPATRFVSNSISRSILTAKNLILKTSEQNVDITFFLKGLQTATHCFIF